MAKTTDEWLQNTFGVKPRVARPKLADPLMKRSLREQQRAAPIADLNKRPAERFSISPGGQQEQMLAEEGFSPQMVIPGHEKKRGEFMAEARHTLSDPTKGELGLLQKLNKAAYGITGPELFGKTPVLALAADAPATPMPESYNADYDAASLAGVDKGPQIRAYKPSKYGHSAETMNKVGRYRESLGPNAQTEFSKADIDTPSGSLARQATDRGGIVSSAPAFDPELHATQTQNALTKKWLGMKLQERQPGEVFGESRGPRPGSPEEAARMSPEVFSIGGDGGYGMGSNSYRDVRNRRMAAESKFDDTVRRARNAGVSGPALGRVIQEASAIRSQEELGPQELEAGERMASEKIAAERDASMADMAQRRDSANRLDLIQLAQLGLNKNKFDAAQNIAGLSEARAGREEQAAAQQALNEGVASAVEQYELPEWSRGILQQFSAQFGKNPMEVARLLQEELDADPTLRDVSEKDRVEAIDRARAGLITRLSK